MTTPATSRERCVALTRAGRALLALTLLISACAAPPPPNPNDACAILKDRKSWYHAAIEARERWNMPVALTLAFVHQESSFKARARPERKKLFGFIPWKRPTSAYGYSQAIDGTWKQYKEETGRRFARRSSFRDSTDFMGWYNDKSVKTLGISPNDAYNLYLAYHEGWGGYRKKSYLRKSWLTDVAKKVRTRMRTYEKQLRSCAGELKGPWYRLWVLETGAEPPDARL